MKYIYFFLSMHICNKSDRLPEVFPGCTSSSIGQARESDRKQFKEALPSNISKRSNGKALEAVMAALTESLQGSDEVPTVCIKDFSSRLVTGGAHFSQRIRALNYSQVRVPCARLFLQGTPGNVVLVQNVQSMNLEAVYVMPLGHPELPVAEGNAEIMVGLRAVADKSPASVTWC